MDFTQLTPEQRTACSRLFGAMFGSIRGLPRDECGEDAQIALTWAYQRVYGVLDDLWDQMEASYPVDDERAVDV